MKFLKFGLLVFLMQMMSQGVMAQSRDQRLVDDAHDLWLDGKNDQAIERIKRALEINPKNADAYYQRGRVYTTLREYDKTIADFTEAIKLSYKPLSIVLSTRGEVYYLLGEYDKAIEDCSEAIRLLPQSPYAWECRGHAYFYKGEYEKAISDCTEAIRLNPKFTSAWNVRGNSYCFMGEYDKAIADYKEVINIGETYNESYSKAYINIIAPLARKLQFAAAKEYYDQYKSKGLRTYIDQNPDWNFFKSYLSAATADVPGGSFDYALKNLDYALTQYGTEIKSTNKSGYIDILALKGYVLEQLKKYPEAKDVYSQALVINSNQPNVKEALQRLEQQQVVVHKTDKTPPVIELLTPQAARGLNIVSAEEITQITGRAKDESGIEQLTVNGKVIKAEEDGLFVSSLPLKAGQNEILISATDKQGNKAERTFIITGNIVAKQDNATVEIVLPVTGVVPQYHAILIAEKDYADASISDLQNPVKDARELKAILQNNYTFLPENIDTIYNGSREDIMQAIVQKCNNLKENDNLVIFYAGHGIAEKDRFGDVDGYWIPSSAKKGLNATYISANDINKALKLSYAKHILVIADACFSGSFTRSLGADATAGIQKQYSVPSRKVMASGNMEPVPDNSRFIYYLKRNLQENKEKYLTAKKLFDSFYEAILNNSSTSPQYAPIKNVGDEGGEFVFIKKE